jgi:bifunctional enzyme CysN/CysC
VGYDPKVFHAIREEYTAFLKNIDVTPACFLPVSGREGDNIATRGDNLTWYDGPTVLETLDAFQLPKTDADKPFRMCVQDVYKFTRFGDTRRVVAGTIATGTIRVGDRVVFYPSGKNSVVASIETFPPCADPEKALRQQSAPDPTGFTLAEQIYVTRGEVAAREGEPPPKVSTRLRASLFWLGRKPLVMEKSYLLRVGTRKVIAQLEKIVMRLDASNLDSVDNPTQVNRHEVAECIIRTDAPLGFDLAADVAETGRFVLIDEYEIQGGGIIVESLLDDQAWVLEKVLTRNIKWEKSEISAAERVERYGQRPGLVLVTGGESSRKRELAKELERALFGEGRAAYYLGIGSLLYGVDADLTRAGVSSRVESREEHLRRFAEVAHLLLDAGMILVATAVELTAADLRIMRTVLQDTPISVIWVGDEITTDVHVDTRVKSAEAAPQALERMKALLTEKGNLFGVANER